MLTGEIAFEEMGAIRIDLLIVLVIYRKISALKNNKCIERSFLIVHVYFSVWFV